MERKLYDYQDRHGDSLVIETKQEDDQDSLAFTVPEHWSGQGGRAVYVPRSEVLSLIQVLTEWAYPHHTSEGPNRSLIEELIAKAAKDAVTAVLPLHLSPVTEHRPQECPGAGQCPEADPEPGDVGHPRPPAAKTDVCADPQCGHRRDRHRKACAVYTPGRGVCRCDVFQELEPLPERKTCPHGLGWSLRCRKCETPRLVEPIAFKPPYCGLCKQPWSDGHGQPGDPCPGVEEARQHPGDWTDALWRVQPSAPASEARYCDECGHSWESYRPEFGQCMSIRGKAVCGCTRRPE